MLECLRAQEIFIMEINSDITIQISLLLMKSSLIVSQSRSYPAV